jgi:hypothetical protein
LNKVGEDTRRCKDTRAGILWMSLDLRGGIRGEILSMDMLNLLLVLCRMKTMKSLAQSMSPKLKTSGSDDKTAYNGRIILLLPVVEQYLIFLFIVMLLFLDLTVMCIGKMIFTNIKRIQNREILL